MACFVVPATEAVISKFASKHCEKSGKVDFAEKLGWLTKLLAGGSVLLGFEHLWHGEITPYAPFLTAVEHEADKAAMFHEMATAGVGMAVACTAVWLAMLAVCAHFEKEYGRENA